MTGRHAAGPSGSGQRGTRAADARRGPRAADARHGGRAADDGAATIRPGNRGRLAGRWRQLTGSASAAVVAFGLLTCACTLVAVAGPRASAQLRTNAFRQLVSQTPALERTVIGTTDDNTMSAGMSPGISDAQISIAQARLTANLASLPLGPAATFWAGLTTPVEPVTDTFPAGLGPDGADLELAYRTGLGRYARVVAGALPAGTPSAGQVAVVQAAVTQATARRFGLRVGSLVPVPGIQLELRITGIVRPADAASPFWNIDPLASAPQLVQPSDGQPYWQAGAFIPASSVLALQTRVQQSDMQISFMFPLDLIRLTGTQALALQNHLASVLGSAGSISVNGNQFPMEVGLTSAAAGIIAGFAAVGSAVASVLALLSVSLAVVGAAVVLLAAWLLADKRREEFTVLRARGASRRQLAVIALGSSVAGAVPGLAAGVLLALLATPGGAPPLAWWLAGLVALAALAGPVVIAVLAHRKVTGTAVRADAPAGRRSSARRLVAEAALVLAAVGGLVVLRDQGGGAAGSDFYPAAAPVLVAVPVAIILLRLYPLVVRLLLRVLGGRARATSFVGLVRAARVPASAVLPAFAMVLALGLVSFSGMVRGAVERGEVAASWQEAGADAVISAPAGITAARQRAIAKVPGVSQVLAVSVLDGQLAGSPVSLVLADPAAYAHYLSGTPLAAAPAAFISGRAPGGVVPALASPGLAAELGRAPVTVTAGPGGRPLRVQVAGQAASMSAVAAIGSQDFRGYLVLPRSAVAAAGTPGTLLVLAPGARPGTLAAAARRLLPGAAVVSRPALLAQLESAPLQHGTYLALALGGDAAAVSCLLVLLLSLLMSGASREMTLARMSTMGLSAAQGRRLAMVEALPLVVAVLVGGLASATVLAPLVGPELSLSVFTGSTKSVPVRLEPGWLLATAAGLLVLALLTLAAQAVVASRGTPRSLRIGG